MKEYEIAYWTISGDTDHHRFEGHSELAGMTGYLCYDDARAAAEAVLARELDKAKKKIAAHNKNPQPDSAKPAWDNDKCHACFVQHRIVNSSVEWRTRRRGEFGEDEEAERFVTMQIFAQYRHQWREARQVVKVSKDGSSTITHELKPPGRWSKWEAYGDGGWYTVPSFLSLRLMPWAMTFIGNGPLPAPIEEGA